MKRIAALAFVIHALACGASTMTGRERADHAEDRGMTAERALDRAEQALEELRADDAEPLIREAREALSDPDIVAYPEHSLLKDRAEAADKKVIEVRAEIARREFQQKILLQKQRVEEAVAAFNVALEPIRKPDLGRSEVDAATNAMTDVGDALEEGQEFSSKDQAYAEWAKNIAVSLKQPRAEIDAARKMVEFKEGALEQRKKAEASRDQAKEETETEKKRELYSEALEGFKLCEIGAKAMLADEPELAKRRMSVAEDKSISVEAVQKSCAAEVKSIDKALAKITAKEKAALKKAAKKPSIKKAKPKKKKKR